MRIPWKFLWVEFSDFDCVVIWPRPPEKVKKLFRFCRWQTVRLMGINPYADWQRPIIYQLGDIVFRLLSQISYLIQALRWYGCHGCKGTHQFWSMSTRHPPGTRPENGIIQFGTRPAKLPTEGLYGLQCKLLTFFLSSNILFKQFDLYIISSMYVIIKWLWWSGMHF